MIKKTFVDNDTLETEIIFGRGSVLAGAKIDFGRGFSGKLKFTHIEPPQEIGEPVDTSNDSIEIVSDVNVPVDCKGVIKLVIFLNSLTEETLDKTFTFSYSNGKVILNFNNYNEKSIEVVKKPIKQLVSVLALLENVEVDVLIQDTPLEDIFN